VIQRRLVEGNQSWLQGESPLVQEVICGQDSKRKSRGTEVPALLVNCKVRGFPGHGLSLFSFQPRPAREGGRKGALSLNLKIGTLHFLLCLNSSSLCAVPSASTITLWSPPRIKAHLNVNKEAPFIPKDVCMHGKRNSLCKTKSSGSKMKDSLSLEPLHGPLTIGPLRLMPIAPVPRGLSACSPRT
jgi:hypothetical protein